MNDKSIPQHFLDTSVLRSLLLGTQIYKQYFESQFTDKPLYISNYVQMELKIFTISCNHQINHNINNTSHTGNSYSITSQFPHSLITSHYLIRFRKTLQRTNKKDLISVNLTKLFLYFFSCTESDNIPCILTTAPITAIAGARNPFSSTCVTIVPNSPINSSCSGRVPQRIKAMGVSKLNPATVNC